MVNSQSPTLSGSSLSFELDRLEFLWHLTRIYCSGQVSDVAFSGQFQASALSHDETLLVLAPPLGGVPPLPKEIGVPNLDILLKRMKQFCGTQTDKIAVRLAEHQLVMSSQHTEVAHPLVNPEQISSRMNQLVIEKLKHLMEGETSDLSLHSVLSGVWAVGEYAAPCFELLCAPGMVRMKVRVSGEVVAEERLIGVPLDQGCDFRLLIDRKLQDIGQTFEASRRASLTVRGPQQPLTIEVEAPGGHLYHYLLTPLAGGGGSR